jgi:hypothetical protein
MKFLVLTLVTFLAGCSLTHEEKQALAASMHSAGQAMHQETQRMNQRLHEQNLQNTRNMQPIAPMPMNCFTTYNALMRAYETRCN